MLTYKCSGSLGIRTYADGSGQFDSKRGDITGHEQRLQDVLTTSQRDDRHRCRPERHTNTCTKADTQNTANSVQTYKTPH